MKKRVNYLKILALILLIIEIGIAVWVDQGVAKEDLTIWRLYVACILFIPINIFYIFTKQTIKIKKRR